MPVPNILLTTSVLGAQQAIGTKEMEISALHLLYYILTNPGAIIHFKESYMVIQIYSNEPYY